MQTLYLIRHTAPDIAPGTCYGQLDIGAADSFEEEASHVLRWLADWQNTWRKRNTANCAATCA